MSYDYKKTKFERKHIITSQNVFINIEQIELQNHIWVTISVSICIIRLKGVKGYFFPKYTMGPLK